MNKQFFFTVLTMILFISCSGKTNYINDRYEYSQSSIGDSDITYTHLNSAIKEIANQLLLNIPSSKTIDTKFVITTFVNLNNFQKTSKFARVISESLIDELHTKRFSIIDYRTQDVLSVDKNGEYLLTRDYNKLKSSIPESLLLVGTYSIIDKKTLVINARIIDNFTSEVISTAKVLYTYKNCRYLEICLDEDKTNISNILEDK